MIIAYNYLGVNNITKSYIISSKIFGLPLYIILTDVHFICNNKFNSQETLYEQVGYSKTNIIIILRKILQGMA